MGLAWKSRRLAGRPCSGVPYWSLVVSPRMPSTSVSSRAIQMARPSPWRPVCAWLAERDPLPGGYLRPAIRQRGLSPYHQGDPLVVEPPEIGARQNASITDDLVPAGIAGPIGPGWNDQPSAPECLVCLEHDHLQR
jgi:hypothetical protein